MGKRAKRVEPYAWTRNLLALLKNKGSVRVLVCLAAGARTFSALESETGLDASTLYKRLCTLLDFRQVEKRNTVARNRKTFEYFLTQEGVATVQFIKFQESRISKVTLPEDVRSREND